MKTLFILFFAFTTTIIAVKNQDKVTVKATFDEFDEEIYYFTNVNEEEGSYNFDKIDAVASKKYDLKDVKFKGKIFEVTYISETELDENDDEYSTFTILDLKLIE